MDPTPTPTPGTRGTVHREVTASELAPPPLRPPSVALLGLDEEITVLAARCASYAEALTAAETAGAAARPRLEAAQAEYDDAIRLWSDIRRARTTGSQDVVLPTNPSGSGVPGPSGGSEQLGPGMSVWRPPKA